MKRKTVIAVLVCLILGSIALTGCSDAENQNDNNLQNVTAEPSLTGEASDVGSSEMHPSGEAPVNDSTPSEIPVASVTPELSTAAPEPTPITTPEPTPTLTPEQIAAQEAQERLEKAMSPTKGEVSFSRAGYFFNESFELELILNSELKGEIRYTTDGTEPGKKVTLYEQPIIIEAVDGENLNIGYVIRAKAFYEDGTESACFSHTYFAGEGMDSRFTTLVISIIGDDSKLRQGPDGILYGNNYSARGSKSEREVYIECIDTLGQKVFSQGAGVRVFGAGSRKHELKSLKLFARKEYDPDHGTFKIDAFGTEDYQGEIINKYDKLVLRNSGDDFLEGFIRDELSSRLVEQAGFSDYEAVVPAVCFINGEYYALYWLHEFYCDKYFQKKYGETDGEYVVLEGSDSGKSVSGSELEIKAAKEYNSIYYKYSRADLTVDSVYEELNKLIDVENYLDYMCYNICIGNADWPQGNYRCYRYYANDGMYDEDGPRDGRYRYLMHDSDCGYAMWRSTRYSGADINDFEAVIGDSSRTRYSALLTRLLKREDCRNYFYGKAWEYINGVLSYDNVCSTLEQMCSERDEEMAFFIRRLQKMKLSVNADSVERNIERIRKFVYYRPDFFEEWICEYKPEN